MGVSSNKQKLASKYRKDAARYKEGRPYALNEDQFKGLLEVFYYEMEGHGFFTRIEDAIAKNGYFFADFQRQISEAMLKAVFMRQSTTIGISLTRQIGKTTIVTAVASFCYKHFFKAFGESFRLCIIAPEKGTASEVFNRVCRYIIAENPELYVDQATYKETLRGDTIQLFGIHEDSKGSTIEGRTFHLVIRDEAHLGDDEKFSDQVVPTTIATQGTLVWIGNGSLGDCDYRKVLKRGNIEIKDKEGMVMGYNRVFRFTYHSLHPYMKKLAMEHKLNSALAWLQGVEKYIYENGGPESFFVRKNVFCEFILNFSNFLDEETIMRCQRDIPLMSLRSNPERDLYLSLDFGHSGDKTVATFLNIRREIEGWFVAKEENEIMTLQDQCIRVRDYADEMGYTQRLLAIGGDSTGLGIGAVEFLEIEFETAIVPCNFNYKWKHENYLQMRDLFMTDRDEDRIWFDPASPNAGKFIKEMTEMEITPLKNGYLSFHAPNRSGYYDDFCASLAIAVYLLVNEYNMYNSLTSAKKRLRSGRSEEAVSRSARERANDLRANFMSRGTNVGTTARIAEKGVGDNDGFYEFSATMGN